MKVGWEVWEIAITTVLERMAMDTKGMTWGNWVEGTHFETFEKKNLQTLLTVNVHMFQVCQQSSVITILIFRHKATKKEADLLLPSSFSDIKQPKRKGFKWNVPIIQLVKEDKWLIEILDYFHFNNLSNSSNIAPYHFLAVSKYHIHPPQRSNLWNHWEIWRHLNLLQALIQYPNEFQKLLYRGTLFYIKIKIFTLRLWFSSLCKAMYTKPWKYFISVNHLFQLFWAFG